MKKYTLTVDVEMVTFDTETFVVLAEDDFEATKKVQACINKAFDNVDDWEITEQVVEDYVEPPYIDPNQIDIEEFLSAKAAQESSNL